MAKSKAREAKRLAKDRPGCVLRELPLAVALADAAMDRLPDVQALALLKSKRWPASGVRLTVQLLETRSAGFRTLLLSHFNSWGEHANVEFTWTSGQGQVRVAFAADGLWSYLGRDILSIPAGQPTMNLQGYTEQTPDAEWRRGGRHEVGHTLGFPHEQLRPELVKKIVPQKAYDYFWRQYGWSRAMVDNNVLTPLDLASIDASPELDTRSLMMYQLPGAIMSDGVPVAGGGDISPIDARMGGVWYPKTPVPPVPPPPPAPAGVLTIDPVGKRVTLPAGWTVANS